VLGKAAAYIVTTGHKKSPNKVEHYPSLFGLVKPSLWVFSTANMVNIFEMTMQKPLFFV
jgi:hypothetical protein